MQIANTKQIRVTSYYAAPEIAAYLSKICEGSPLSSTKHIHSPANDVFSAAIALIQLLDPERRIEKTLTVEPQPGAEKTNYVKEVRLRQAWLPLEARGALYASCENPETALILPKDIPVPPRVVEALERSNQIELRLNSTLLKMLRPNLFERISAVDAAKELLPLFSRNSL